MQRRVSHAWRLSERRSNPRVSGSKPSPGCPAARLPATSFLPRPTGSPPLPPPRYARPRRAPQEQEPRSTTSAPPLAPSTRPGFAYPGSTRYSSEGPTSGEVTPLTPTQSAHSAPGSSHLELYRPFGSRAQGACAARPAQAPPSPSATREEHHWPQAPPTPRREPAQSSARRLLP